MPERCRKHFLSYCEECHAPAAPPVTETPEVTRVEVIDHRTDRKPFERGRIYSAWGVRVELSYQDGGKTLKVFVTDRPRSPTDAL